jgi:hypothetical protein
MSSSVSVVLAAPGDPGEPTDGATATATATASPTASPAVSPGGGSGLVPAVKPNMNSTGMSGFTDLTNTIAGWVLLGCLAGFLVSALVFVLGPAVGLQHGRRYGTMGIISALGVAVLVALAAGLINLAYTMFGGV